jgi:hypothetical protein
MNTAADSLNRSRTRRRPRRRPVERLHGTNL